MSATPHLLSTPVDWRSAVIDVIKHELPPLSRPITPGAPPEVGLATGRHPSPPGRRHPPPGPDRTGGRRPADADPSPTAAGPPNGGVPSLLKPLSRWKESRRRERRARHGPSAASFPARSMFRNRGGPAPGPLPRHRWPIQGSVTDISAFCNANPFAALTSPWRATVWDLGTQPGTGDCAPAPARDGVHEREVTDSCLFLVRRSA
jgi:hypothetical protein